jgi:hypothetical protein
LLLGELSAPEERLNLERLNLGHPSIRRAPRSWTPINSPQSWTSIRRGQNRWVSNRFMILDIHSSKSESMGVHDFRSTTFVHDFPLVRDFLHFYGIALRL